MICKRFRSVLLAFALTSLTATVFMSAAHAAEPATAEQLLAQMPINGSERAAVMIEGKKAAFFCANCHGDNGMSRYPGVPNLAGQNPAYILSQIDAFLTGRRKDEFMQGLMKVLSERDKVAIALYFSSLPVVPATAPGPRAAEGAQFFAKQCAHCHRPDARGDQTFPRLAGQQREYLRTSLSRYLSQSGGRLYPPMTAAITQLGTDNIDAVADYLSGLK